MVTDEDGTRQATLLIPQGTTAQLVMPDGSTQVITSLNVRASEYTVGPDGPKAMPAKLPSTSGYTYAVELSADEAIATGATEVRFSQPLYYYVEDFIGFPVGGAVPAGYYDRQKGQWIASANGRIIRIIGLSGDLAELDTDGDGSPDNGLAVTDAERRQIASLYAVGQALWRVPITHFTPWDFNWPYGPPPGAKAPQTSGPRTERDEPKRDNGKTPICIESGSSFVECQSQTLGERIPVVGTTFTLNYRSDRQQGRVSSRTLTIPLSGESIPSSLRSIILEIEIAGRKFTQEFMPTPNIMTTFTWDGLDAYGRKLQGSQPIKYRIEYLYTAQYYAVPADYERSFARFNASTDLVIARESTTLSFRQTWKGYIGTPDIETVVAGWTMDVHHFYSPADQTLYFGDGSRKSSSVWGKIIDT